MKVLKRLITAAVCLVLLLLGATVWITMRAGEQGQSEIERWIGGQILGMVNSRINPQLSFEDLDYQYPATVRVKKLALSAKDPRKSDLQLDILAAEEAVIELAEVPQVGQPIVLEKVTLFTPSARLVRNDVGKGLVGFTRMVKRPSTLPATRQRIQARLKEVLNIRKIELVDGRIEYDPRIEGTQPMVVDRVTAVLDVHPETEGQYRIQMNVGREPVASGTLRGLFDLDEMKFADAQARISADLSSGKLSFLPPQAQAWAQKYSTRGRLAIEADGELPLAEPELARLTAAIHLESANFRIDELSFPIESLDCRIRFADKYFEIDRMSMAALKGEVNLTGGVRVGPRRETGMDLQFEDILLHELLAEQPKDESSLCGRMSGRIRIDAPLGVITAKQRAMRDDAHNPVLASEPWPAHWGSGTIEVTEACLVRVPGMSQITTAIGNAASLVTNEKPRRQEKLHLVFELNENRIKFSEIQYIGDMLAGGGKGTLTLDQRLDLTLSGGPVDRMARMFGKGLGTVFGTVSDQVASYHVGGTTTDPKVSVVVAPAVMGGVERLGEMFRRKNTEKPGG